MSLENLDDITDEELEAAGVDLDDPDSIDAYLEGREQPEREDDTSTEPTDTEQDEDGDTSGQSEEKGEEQASKPEPDSQQDQKTDSKDGGKSDQDNDPVVYAADGKHTLPFTYVKGLRDENRELKGRAQELESKYSELQAKAEKSEKLEAFLAEKGIDFEDPDTITKEDLEEMSNLDPAVGKLGKLLVKVLESKQPEADQPQAVEDEPAGADSPVEQAIAANEDLVAWREDPDRWSEVVRIDSVLMGDAKWKDKPLGERFAEVVRISKLMNDEPVDSPTGKPSRDKEPSAAEKAAAKVAEAEQRGNAPTSLSNLGKSPDTEKSFIEQLAEKSEDELVDMIMQGKITDEQLEEASLLL